MPKGFSAFQTAVCVLMSNFGFLYFYSCLQMENRMVILCCNLKPAKMRGVLSQAMVMCAATPDKVELLIPPKGVEPGDRVSCEGYERKLTSYKTKILFQFLC